MGSSHCSSIVKRVILIFVFYRRVNRGLGQSENLSKAIEAGFEPSLGSSATGLQSVWGPGHALATVCSLPPSGRAQGPRFWLVSSAVTYCWCKPTRGPQAWQLKRPPFGWLQKGDCAPKVETVRSWAGCDLLNQVCPCDTSHPQGLTGCSGCCWWMVMTQGSRISPGLGVRVPWTRIPLLALPLISPPAWGNLSFSRDLWTKRTSRLHILLVSQLLK